MQQLAMIAFLDDMAWRGTMRRSIAAMVERRCAIAITVSAGHQVEQLSPWDGGFGLTVESAGRLIEDQNGRVLEKDPRNGAVTLALASQTKLHSTLAHTRLVTPAAILVLQSKNELVRMCALRSLNGPLDTGIGLPV